MAAQRTGVTLQPDETVDVAVIGTGFAGLSAAIEASSHGCENICLIEKMDAPGGNSVYNAGQVAAVKTPHQLRDGISDGIDQMVGDMMKAGLDLNHRPLLETMVSESADTVRWTEDMLGVRYRDRLTQLGGHSVPRTLSTLNSCGKDIIDPLLTKVAQDASIELRMGTKVVDIIMEDEAEGSPWGVRVGPLMKGEGKLPLIHYGSRLKKEGTVKVHPGVWGIRVQTMRKDGGATLPTRLIRCRKGLILAAGGFSADVPFRSVQNPALDSTVPSTNQPGATSEVLRAALRVGATPIQLDRIQLVPFTSPDEEGFGQAPFFCLGGGFPYGIVVDPETSKRFINELGSRSQRTDAILKLGHPAVCVADSVGAQHSLIKDLSKLEPAVQKCDTLEGLAEAFGMDGETLKGTIDEYNAGVDVGVDAIGKPLRDDAKPIAVPPFYATRLWPKVHHTMGGLGISSKGEVLHVDGSGPIPGLYAAGEITGGVHGADRLGSCATTDCLTFGRIAGRNVVLDGASHMGGETRGIEASNIRDASKEEERDSSRNVTV